MQTRLHSIFKWQVVQISITHCVLKVVQISDGSDVNSSAVDASDMTGYSDLNSLAENSIDRLFRFQ